MGKLHFFDLAAVKGQNPFAVIDAAALLYSWDGVNGFFNFFQFNPVPHIFDLKILSSAEDKLSSFII